MQHPFEARAKENNDPFFSQIQTSVIRKLKSELSELDGEINALDGEIMKLKTNKRDGKKLVEKCKTLVALIERENELDRAHQQITEKYGACKSEIDKIISNQSLGENLRNRKIWEAKNKLRYGIIETLDTELSNNKLNDTTLVRIGRGLKNAVKFIPLAIKKLIIANDITFFKKGIIVNSRSHRVTKDALEEIKKHRVPLPKWRHL